MNNLATNISQNILKSFEDLKLKEPKIRALDAAKKLNISEGELVSARVGTKIVRLSDDCEEILKQIEALGEVMALTRNLSCVHERKGIYQNPSFNKHGRMSVGLFANKDIDLRLFMDHWKYCFAVTEGEEKLQRKSIQFFDKSGLAIHKIYLTESSNQEEYDKIVEKFKSENQQNFINVENYEVLENNKKDEEVDWAEFRKTWQNLKDTHDFYPMLRKFKVDRQQAFRKIGEDFAYKVGNDSARKILELATKKKCEIMVFVGNRGCIQIHTGEVKNLKEFGTWYNVLDDKFNLHLNESNIKASWITKKPTEDGIVTALEIFDEDNEIIATFFGKRKPGIAELELWREIANEIVKI